MHLQDSAGRNSPSNIAVCPLLGDAALGQHLAGSNFADVYCCMLATGMRTWPYANTVALYPARELSTASCTQLL